MAKRTNSEYPHAIAGVPGRMMQAHAWPDRPDLLSTQAWVSESRPVKEYGPKALMRVKLRFDDNCKNGRATFSITADIYIPGKRDIEAGGCLHDEITKRFPELEYLIKWHLVSTDGPMHYIANTLYHAGDRDHYGLRKGEKRVIRGPDGLPCWTLQVKTAHPHGMGIALSDSAIGREYAGRDHVPLFIVKQQYKGESPPVTPVLEWVPNYRFGEGKERDFTAARSIAVWPEATDAELSADPEQLKAALLARLQALLECFRTDMDSCGFAWDATELQP